MGVLSRQLIVELQSVGVRLDTGTNGVRRGGAGPSDAIPLRFGELTFMVPAYQHATTSSPYTLQSTESGSILKRLEEPICTVELVAKPRFYRGQTSDGIPYWKIALLHGTNCLASTVVQACIHWRFGEQCRFCAIGISLGLGNTVAVKQPTHLAEVAAAAVELDGVKHLVLTTGTINRQDKGARYLAACTGAVKRQIDLPVHVQCEPPDDLEMLEVLHEAGVDSIGIHVESFDTVVRGRTMPGKARVSLEHYWRTLDRAVSLFGANQVSSFIIAGLGEDPESIVAGSKRLAAMGVYPFVVPLRSIAGTGMESVSPPSGETMFHIYDEISSCLKASGLSWQRSKAGCVRCGACSALPAFD